MFALGVSFYLCNRLLVFCKNTFCFNHKTTQRITCYKTLQHVTLITATKRYAMLQTGMLQSMQMLQIQLLTAKPYMSNVTQVFLQTLQMLQTCYGREFPNVTNRYKSLQIVTNRDWVLQGVLLTFPMVFFPMCVGL